MSTNMKKLVISCGQRTYDFVGTKDKIDHILELINSGNTVITNLYRIEFDDIEDYYVEDIK